MTLLLFDSLKQQVLFKKDHMAQIINLLALFAMFCRLIAA